MSSGAKQSLACVLVRKQVCLSDGRDPQAVGNQLEGEMITLPGGSGAAAAVNALRAAVVAVVVTIFKEMPQIKVSCYQGAACRRFVQTEAACLHSLSHCPNGAEKCRNKHASLQIYIVFTESSRAQTSSEAGFTNLSRMQQPDIDWKSCSSGAASEQRP